jgi:small conductance mechanosensitive channel
MGNLADLAIRKLETIVEGFFWMLPNFGFALLTFALFYAGAWIARASITRVFRYRTRSDLGDLIGGFAKWAIIAFGLLVVATIIFPSIRPADALATLGIGSIAIGFAFKDILQNWIAGLLILIRQPFRLGDQIVVSNYEGTVEHIEARGTIIKTYDGRRVVIPNGEVYTRALVVNTAFPKRRSEYDIPIDVRGDIGEASRVIMETLSVTEGVEREPAPDVVPWEVTQGEIRLKVRWWTNSRRRYVVATRGRVIAGVKGGLEDVGIPMPHNTQVVLFSDEVEKRDQRQAEDLKLRHSHEPPVEGEAAEERPQRAGRVAERSRR